MSWFSRWLRGQAGLLRGRPENVWRDLIARHAVGRSFLDVGCMWRVNGAYAFHALDHGASRVTGIDLNAATPDFNERNSTTGNRVQFVQADVNDPHLPACVGAFDVVFCSGVLYHVPNMQHTLDQLRRLCTSTLILATASLPERETPQAAVFLPYMDPAARAALDYWHHSRKRGLDSEVLPERGYANWFWLPTPSCLRAMLRFSGFTVRESFEHRRVVTVVATAAPVETQWAPTNATQPDGGGVV